jgi:hypothetical protein
VAADSGKIIWQRRLGVVCRPDPIADGEHVWVMGDGGGLLCFEPSAEHKGNGRDFHQWAKADVPPLEQKPNLLQLQWSPDKKHLCQLASVVKPDGVGGQITHNLVIRRIAAGQTTVQTTTHGLPDEVVGTPGIGQDDFILLLANGELCRVRPDAEPERGGVTWRSIQADPEAAGHVLYLGIDDFVTTDGGRGMTRWNWPAKGGVPTKQKGIDLPDRIARPPILVEIGQSHGGKAICVADTAGVVRLLSPTDLTTWRSWNLHGDITAGPFQRGNQIGCICDRRRLVWLGPDRQDTLWQYQAGEQIAGEPQIVGGVVLVADDSGKLTALDPATGQPRGAGSHLEGTVVPVCTPVALGKDHILVPLSDGTALLPSAKRLR